MAKVMIQEDRIIFDCPGCECSHVINSTWDFNGDVDKPTISPSIRVFNKEGTLCHSFVKDGYIQFLSDCKHELADKTVELPDIDLKEWEIEIPR